MAKISFIIPCYYNELNIPNTSNELLKNETNFPEGTEFEYVLVDDGSKDKTLNELLQFQKKHPEKVTVVKLSRNFGAYNAILAGLSKATGDCNVVVTADLQDPIELIPNMYDYWQKGIKLVIGNRQNRKDPFFTKLFAVIFQFLIRKFALPSIPKGGFDFVLFDKQLKDQVLKIDEKNSNSLYLLVWMKHDYVNIPYIREKRDAGESRWTFSKKIKLLVDSFVAFSFLPIRLISLLGFVLGFAAILYSFYIIYLKLSGNIEVQGWATLMLVFLFVSSFQMVSLGILGEYLWRTLDASRNRPTYVIENIYEKF